MARGHNHQDDGVLLSAGPDGPRDSMVGLRGAVIARSDQGSTAELHEWVIASCIASPRARTRAAVEMSWSA